MVDKFDAVVAYTCDTDTDELEMQTEFWSHYSIAPIFAVIDEKEKQEWFKENMTSAAIFIESKDANANDFANAIKQCKEQYEKKVREDVRPAFD
jgi:hypothetical protein